MRELNLDGKSVAIGLLLGVIVMLLTGSAGVLSARSYMVATGDIHDIEDKVEARMKDGWTPLGGVAGGHDARSGASLFAQALVK